MSNNYLDQAFQPARQTYDSNRTPPRSHGSRPVLQNHVSEQPQPFPIHINHSHAHPNQDANGNIYHRAGDPTPQPSLPPHLQYQFGAIAQQNALRQSQQRFPPGAQLRSQATRTQRQSSSNGQTNPQQQEQDVTVQEADDSSDPDSDNAQGSNTAGDKPVNPDTIAPLIQPITPLQLPKVRPTLLLGPHETREMAMNLVQEYAIAQGYVLVQTGSAKAKTSKGEYVPVAEVTRVDLRCDRGGTCKNTGTGKRKRPTNKLGCPTRVKLVCRKRQASKWFIEIFTEEHNHDLDPDNIDKLAAYRRWRRLQGGGPRREPMAERLARKRKVNPKVIPPVPPPPPPPKFHQTGGIGIGAQQQQQQEQPPSNPTTTPLHVAALKGQYKIMEILLRNGAEINALDAMGRTPLHCGVEGERMDVVKLLVERGADVTRVDAKGLSVLHLAVEKGLEDAVELLIENGADPNR